MLTKCVYHHCIENFFLDCKEIFLLWNYELCVVVYRKQKKKYQSFGLKDAKALPGWFAFRTPVPVTITILLEITIPAKREPSMKSFVFLSNVSDKRFGQLFLLKVSLSPFFFHNVFHWCIDERLKVNFDTGLRLFKGIFSAMV